MPRDIVFKCKPTFQFQSIEFDFICESEKDEDEMIALYDRILKKLIQISPEQDGKRKPSQSEPLATDGQKDTMKRFNIPFDSTTTRKQAQALIQASIDKLG